MKFYLLLILLILLGCGGSSSSEAPKKLENSPPVLAFEPAYSVNEQTEIELSVNATDDKGIASYAWQQISGKSVELSNTNESKLNFITPTVLMSEGEQVLEFEVLVTDNEGAPSKANFEVNVKAVNSLPDVTVLAPIEVTSDELITLSAQASDSDGNVISYLWQQISGPQIEILSPAKADTQIKMPHVSNNQEVLIKLVVQDNELSTSEKLIKINLVPQLVHQSEYEIETKSGAYTQIEWQFIDGSAPYEVSLKQVAGPSYPVLTSIDNNRAYFYAPIAEEAPVELTFELSVIDSKNNGGSQNITVSVASPIKQFSDPKVLFTNNSVGHHIYDFDVADMDNDGISDIIASQDNGTYWYKNTGDNRIDFTPNKMRSELEHIKRAYYLKEDLSQDGFLDLVTIQHVEGKNNLYLHKNNGLGGFLTTELIGELNSGQLNQAEVFTFSNAGAIYIVAQGFSSQGGSRNNHFAIYKQDGLNFIKVNTFSTQNDYYAVNELFPLFSCDLTDSGKPNIYYEQRHESPTYLAPAQLYVLSASDDYQTPTLIKEYDFVSSAFACLSSSTNPDQLIQYLNDQFYSQGKYEGGMRTLNIEFDSFTNQYTFTEFESILTDEYFTSSDTVFKAQDINNDQLDDLIILDREARCYSCINSDTIDKTYIRNNQSELSFERYDAYYHYPNGYELAFWREEQAYYAFKQDNNSFILSSLINLQEKLKVEFPKKEKINSVEFFDRHFILNTSDSHGSDNTQYMTIKDDVLVIDENYNLDLFNGKPYVQADLNNDGLLDAIYSYDPRIIDEISHEPGAIVGRLNSPEGFGEEKEFAEIIYYNQLLRAIDVNNDGFLDLSYSSYSYESWFLYQESTDIYEYSSDFSSSPSFVNQFSDFNNDGFLDFVEFRFHGQSCGPFTNCGYLEVKYAQGKDQFSAPKKVDERYFGIKHINSVDIDLDGSEDLMVQAYFRAEGLYHFNWYKAQADGSFEINAYHEPINYRGTGGDLGEYLDLNGTGKPYFVDFEYKNDTGYDVKFYKYNPLLKKPVVGEVQLIPTTIQNYQLIDVDMDKDLDLIQYNDHNIYLIENLH